MSVEPHTGIRFRVTFETDSGGSWLRVNPLIGRDSSKRYRSPWTATGLAARHLYGIRFGLLLTATLLVRARCLLRSSCSPATSLTVSQPQIGIQWTGITDS